MNTSTAHKLIELNNRFYNVNAQSFSSTRNAPWQGWTQLLELADITPNSVLDVACGNMRLKSFLDESCGPNAYKYIGIDACSNLVPKALADHFVQIDLIRAFDAWSGEDLLSNHTKHMAEFDLVCCFGFMHHIPGEARRKDIIKWMLSKCSSDGAMAVSFWQFERDARILRKALNATRKGSEELGLVLEDGDYLLDWKNKEGQYRYCHSFSDEQIDALVTGLSDSANVLARYHADGPSNNLNTYIVFSPTKASA